MEIFQSWFSNLIVVVDCPFLDVISFSFIYAAIWAASASHSSQAFRINVPSMIGKTGLFAEPAAPMSRPTLTSI